MRLFFYKGLGNNGREYQGEGSELLYGEDVGSLRGKEVSLCFGESLQIEDSFVDLSCEVVCIFVG
jgi:hypothetical protein